MADTKEEEKKINPPGLDEGDIQLLKTYVRSEYEYRLICFYILIFCFKKGRSLANTDRGGSDPVPSRRHR